MAKRPTIQPNPGPQWAFLSSRADVVVYGGAAGGGKTYGLLLDVLKRSGIPGFESMAFRRVGTQITLPGGLWSTSRSLYPLAGATGFPGLKLWRWPNGFQIGFRHLEDEKAIGALQGAQIPWIGFDELTHFTRDQFFFLLSRNRSSTGIPGQMRATCNADAASWVKDFVRWWLDDEGRFPDKDKGGVLRWFARDGDRVLWYDSKSAAERQHGPFSATSVTFIPAKLTDNARLLEADPTYLTKLRALGHVLRQRLELGDWLVREVSGTMFRRVWFPVVEAAPVEGTRVRYWDRGATRAHDGAGLFDGPDWTAGVLMSRNPSGRFVIEHVERLRGSPAEVEAAVLRTAQRDGKGVIVGIEQDPGSAGKAEGFSYARLLAGWDVRLRPVSTSKVIRARPLSAQVEAGNVSVVRGEWNEEYFRVLEGFPDAAHDDDVDASSGAFNLLAEAKPFDVEAWKAEALGGSEPDRAVGALG